ncbi:MAG: type IV secretion system DNA-binding domain-containing protein [Roseivirga sp.]
MSRPLVSLLTGLFLYQAFYWIYLLELSGLYPLPFLPSHLLLPHYSLFARAFTLAAFALLLYPNIKVLLLHQDALSRGAYLLLLLLFLFFDYAFPINIAPLAFPLLLAALLLLLPTKETPYASPSLQNPQARSLGPLGIALPTTDGSLPLPNPQRGCLVLGNQGCGKTRFVLEPILYQLIKKGYAGLVYDYDFDALSQFTFNCLLRHKPPRMRFLVVNFHDLTRTSRFNPFAQHCISNRAFLEEYMTVLLANLDPQPHAAPSFWRQSTKVLLKSLLVLLANNHSQHCSLPHALALAMQPINQVLKALASDQEARTYASSILDALEAGDKAAGQLAGITASLKVSLQLLLAPEIFYVLSGEQPLPTINDAQHPTLFCIGNHPPTKAAYSPLIATLITMCFKAMYGHHKQPSFVAIDELPTLFIPDLSELPATARKYGIATVACIQANAQLEHTYGQVGAQKIQQTLVSKFVGNTEDASARYGSELMGKVEKPFKGDSSSSSASEGGHSETTGQSTSYQQRPLFSAQDLMRFSPGEFTGKLAEARPPFFHAHLRAVDAYDRAFLPKHLVPLPSQEPATDPHLLYERIFLEAKSLLNEY